MEDLQLGVESYQKKLNLTKPDTYHSDLKRKEAYTVYSNPRGFIYQNKDKQNRLMWIDELHKFNDGTLNDVRTALDDHLKGSLHEMSTLNVESSLSLNFRLSSGTITSIWIGSRGCDLEHVEIINQAQSFFAILKSLPPYALVTLDRHAHTFLDLIT
nr:hypothetical protein [Tanacetum cinerariifolium]